MIKKYLSLVLLIFSLSVAGSDFEVGFGRKIITPEKLPFWLRGYASREKPASEIDHNLWTKAVVIEDTESNRIIIVTVENLGLTRSITESVADSLMKKYKIDRSQVFFNSSHTHSAPVISPASYLNTEDIITIAKYGQTLKDKIISAVALAMDNLEPAHLLVGHGSATFAKNRRDKKFPQPVDYDVPVLKITSLNGTLMGVLFGYACHNTTLTGKQTAINGDYAGYAQIELEKNHHGIYAMFLQGCGADIDPYPRGNIELAKQHGKSLANAVNSILEKRELIEVKPPIKTDYQVVDLEFKPFDLELYQKDLESTDKFAQRRAILMIDAYNKGWKTNIYSYPIQAVRFNNDFTIIALSGEVVVDYSFMLKKKYPNENLFVAGYCNEVVCYIPSKRILAEGGYEADDSMIYKGLSGPFADDVQDRVLNTIHQIMVNIGVNP